MSEIRQNPVPDNTMRFSHGVLMKDIVGDKWRMIFYVKDPLGRKWATECEVPAPQLLPGEAVFPNEWSNG